jgi:hypothetical protein
MKPSRLLFLVFAAGLVGFLASTLAPAHSQGLAFGLTAAAVLLIATAGVLRAGWKQHASLPQVKPSLRDEAQIEMSVAAQTTPRHTNVWGGMAAPIMVKAAELTATSLAPPNTAWVNALDYSHSFVSPSEWLASPGAGISFRPSNDSFINLTHSFVVENMGRGTYALPPIQVRDVTSTEVPYFYESSFADSVTLDSNENDEKQGGRLIELRRFKAVA